MSTDVVQIARYPNRRFYNRQASKYVSLKDIEEMITAGSNVEIVDSQTNENLTRSVLTRIIMDRQPEKMQLFPIDMLHFILRSNDVMTGFLRDYFRQSLTYLSYLQRHGATTNPMVQPMHWVKAWLDRMTPVAGESGQQDIETTPPGSDEMAERIAKLESRLRMLEQQGKDETTNNK